MNNERKKELAARYREREITGGICGIFNKTNGKILLETSLNIEGNRNRFEFCKNTGSAVSLKLQKDWIEYGADAFTFEVLEELKKGETQTMKEFEEDIKLLKEFWIEKLKDKEFY